MMESLIDNLGDIVEFLNKKTENEPRKREGKNIMKGIKSDKAAGMVSPSNFSVQESMSYMPDASGHHSIDGKWVKPDLSEPMRYSY